MENATKALLIAAGMLLAVMIVSLLVVGYNRISAHYNQQTELLTAEQLDKFNKQFQNYYRDNIRGNELISLMNKIIDYNASQSYLPGTEYKPIKVTITIGGAFVDAFKYETKEGLKIGEKNEHITEIITNTSGSGTKYENDRKLVAITNTPAELEVVASGVGITLTDTQLQKLTMEISNILIDESTDRNYENEMRRLRVILLKNILKLDIATMDDGTYRTKSVDTDKIDAIKEIVSKYYQYTQFKRAYFTCTDLIHDPESGRVVEMDFKVKTKTDAEGNEIVQFD